MRYLAWLAVALAACSADTFVAGDGGGGGDAGVDSAPPLEGGSADACSPSPPLCAQTMTCVNFDQGSISPFQDKSQAPGAIHLIQDQFRSCPTSLESDLPFTGATPGRGVANFDMPGLSLSNPEVVLDLWVMLPTQPDGAFSAFALYAGDSSVGLHYANGKWLLHVDASNQDQGITPGTGQWNHMRLDVVFSTDTGIGKATLNYDDVNGNPGPPANVADRTWGGSPTNQVGELGATLGIEGLAQQEIKVDYDDVQLTLP